MCGGGWYSEIGHVKEIDDLKHLKKWVASHIDTRKNAVFFCKWGGLQIWKLKISFPLQVIYEKKSLHVGRILIYQYMSIESLLCVELSVLGYWELWERTMSPYLRIEKSSDRERKLRYQREISSCYAQGCSRQTKQVYVVELWGWQLCSYSDQKLGKFSPSKWHSNRDLNGKSPPSQEKASAKVSNENRPNH